MKKPPIFVLLFMISFASVGATLYTPALPALTEALGIHASAAQFTVTIYLAGYALGQLIYGPLCNRVGRRGALFIGGGVALVGAIGSTVGAFLDLFWLIAIGRLVMALGACAGLVATFTMVADSYNEVAARRVLSFSVLSFATFPYVAVAVGGLLTTQWGWQSCFIFLIGYCLMILWMVSRLPETAPRETRRASPIGEVARGYLGEVRNTILITGGLIMGCGTAMIYVFAARAPFTAIDYLDLSPSQFGFYNLVPSAGFVIGGLFSILFSGRLRSERAIILGVSIVTACSVVMLLLQALGRITTTTLFVPAAAAFAGIVIEYTAVSAIITTRTPDRARASALMSFLNLSVPVGAVVALQMLSTHRLLVTPAFFVALASTMVILSIFFVRATVLAPSDQ